MADVLMERISADPGFQQLLAVAVEAISAETNALRDMDDEQRVSHAAKGRALRRAVKSGAASKKGGAFAELGVLIGEGEADAEALVLRARDGAKEFNAAVPELKSMDERQVLDILAEVVKHDPALAKAAESFSTTPAMAEESEKVCLGICIGLLALFLAAEIAVLIYSILQCVWLALIPPLFILCLVGAFAFISVMVALTITIYSSCVTNCTEEG